MDRERLKHIGTIATAVAAIVTALVALLREPPEPRARASYDVLSKKVEELQAAQKQQHDDTVAMRGYLDGYLKSLRDGQKALAEAPAPPVAPSGRKPVSAPPAAAALSAVPPPPSLPSPKARPDLEAPPDFAQLAK